jgi:hypothetical protein
MVARIYPHLHGFHVVLERDGQELDAEVAPILGPIGGNARSVLACRGTA